MQGEAPEAENWPKGPKCLEEKSTETTPPRAASYQLHNPLKQKDLARPQVQEKLCDDAENPRRPAAFVRERERLVLIERTVKKIPAALCLAWESQSLQNPPPLQKKIQKEGSQCSWWWGSLDYPPSGILCNCDRFFMCCLFLPLGLAKSRGGKCNMDKALSQ